MTPRTLHPVARVVASYNGVPCTHVRPDDAPQRPGEVCGQIHQRCRGHTNDTSGETGRGGDPCRNHASPGQLVCFRHGGAAKQNIAAADRRMARDRALGEVGKLMVEALGVVSAMSGTEQLVMAINQAGARALCYQWLLDELPETSKWSWSESTDDKGSRTRWVNVNTEGLIGPDAQGVQHLHAYEEGLRHWTALHGRLLKAAADIGLEERRQRFQQDQVASIGTAVRGIVEGLGRDLDDPTVVPVVEAALRAITAGAAA